MKQLEEIKERIESDLNLEMLSSREAYIFGSTDIVALGENEIAVDYKKIRIVFSGTGLLVDFYNADGIKITGKIEKTEFLQREQ